MLTVKSANYNIDEPDVQDQELHEVLQGEQAPPLHVPGREDQAREELWTPRQDPGPDPAHRGPALPAGHHAAPRGGDGLLLNRLPQDLKSQETRPLIHDI